MNSVSRSNREIELRDDFEYSGNDVLLFDNRIKREWLTTKEAASFLGVSENALRIMVHRNQIGVYKLGRRLRFRLIDCMSLFEKKGA